MNFDFIEVKVGRKEMNFRVREVTVGNRVSRFWAAVNDSWQPCKPILGCCE